MKKILSVFAMMAILFAACTPEDQPGTNNGGNENEGGNNNGGENTEKPEAAPELKLTTAATLDFTAEGGDGSISYVISNPVEGVTVSAACEADWVTGLKAGETRATFTVAPYESTEAPRSTKIVLTYDKAPAVEVNVTQQPAAAEVKPDAPDVEFTASTLYGQYFGNAASEGYNYYVILTDSVLGINEDGDLLVDVGSYYILDVYSDVAVGDGEMVLPLGVYEFDDLSTGTPGTISESYSLYVEVLNEVNQMSLTSATLTVTEGKVELLAVIGNKTHKVIYEGDLTLTPPDGSEEQEGPLSNLTEDYSVESDNAYIQVEYYGDYYQMGLDNWMISCFADGDTFEGDFFSFEVLTPIGAGFAGEYPSFFYNEYDGSTNVMLSRYNEADAGSMYLTVANTEDGLAPTGERISVFVDGEMLIEFNPETYECTLMFDGIDDAGYNVVANLSGVAEVYGLESSASYVKKNRASSKTNGLKNIKSLKTPSKSNTFVMAR